MPDPEISPDDLVPIQSTPAFQADVAKTLAGFNEILAKRAEQRELLLRTKTNVYAMTVEETVGDESAVAYLLNQSQALADLVLDYHDNIVADFTAKRDSLAGIIEEN